MAAKKVGTLIKEARTKAGLTQEQLASKVAGVTAGDISKAERGEKELTEAQLKAIAKATGVTQKSLLEAPKGGSASASSGSGSGSMKLTADEKKLVKLYREADDKTKQAVIELFNEGAEQTGSILSSLLGGGSGGSALSGIGGFLGSLLGGGGSSGGSGNLLGSLLGGGSGNNSGNSGGNILGSLIGGVLGGKRDMPEGDGEEVPGDLKVYDGGKES